jgi:lipopolysaccharide biosynthesis glycosyltransferase
MTAYLYHNKRELIRKYGKSNLQDAMKNPLIVHYLSRTKPWTYRTSIRAEEWWKYANMQNDGVIQKYIKPFVKKNTPSLFKVAEEMIDTVMKKIHIMLCLALGILVSGCFTSYVSTKQMMGIYQGMTQSQVESVLGKPDFRRFDGDMEEWEFHRDNGTPVLTSEPVTIIVQFVNREVVSMDTFKGYGRPAPMHSIVVPPAVNTTVEVFPNHEQVEEARLMTDPEFDEFINKLKITVMNEDQKKLVDRMLRTYDVTSNQCVKIVKEISYTPDQVEMMKKLYPYVRDKRNFNKVIDILFSNAYKDEMRKFIEEYHQNNK